MFDEPSPAKAPAAPAPPAKAPAPPAPKAAPKAPSDNVDDLFEDTPAPKATPKAAPRKPAADDDDLFKDTSNSATPATPVSTPVPAVAQPAAAAADSAAPAAEASAPAAKPATTSDDEFFSDLDDSDSKGMDEATEKNSAAKPQAQPTAADDLFSEPSDKAEKNAANQPTLAQPRQITQVNRPAPRSR